MAQKLWDVRRRNCGTGRRNYGILHGRAEIGAGAMEDVQAKERDDDHKPSH